MENRSFSNLAWPSVRNLSKVTIKRAQGQMENRSFSNLAWPSARNLSKNTIKNGCGQRLRRHRSRPAGTKTHFERPKSDLVRTKTDLDFPTASAGIQKPGRRLKLFGRDFTLSVIIGKFAV